MNRLGAAIALLLCATVPGAALASKQEGWQFELSPYLWAFGLDGEAYARDKSANFSQDFSDISDNLDGGGSALFVGSYNRWVAMVQYDFATIELNGDDIDERVDEFAPGVRVRGTFDTTIGTGAIGYRFDTFGETSWIDVMVGVRDLQLDQELRVSGDAYDTPPTVPPTTTRVARTFKGDAESTDTIVMLRPSIRISERWRFNPTLSLAVAGDSEDHYELSPQFQYQFSDFFALRMGYRRLNYDIEEGGNRGDANYRRFSGDISGLMLGVGWTFPRHEAPAPAAAPAPAPKPAPAPARPPADTDGDGVIDANDKCPNTPKGARVGPQGCDCDVSVQLQFEFDSAKLTDSDKQELKRTADRLEGLHWISGVAEGHTDSIGSDAYNQSLSERRAQAVIDYMATLGVDASRMKAVGRGEADPVADNGTSEGRAQNRRVILKRTDCDTPK